MNSVILEACVDSVKSARYAEQHGAHRLELCSNLHLDGTTPEIELIREVLDAVNIPVKVMIRPRGGDFVYNEMEFDEMQNAISNCKAIGIPEIATGILRSDKSLDLERLKILAQHAAPMTLTIHKCIDLVPDIMAAIEQLKTIPGVGSILSSGKAATALQGAGVLKEMLAACSEDLTLILAGSVTSENLVRLQRLTGAREYHGRRIVGGDTL